MAQEFSRHDSTALTRWSGAEGREGRDGNFLAQAAWQAD